MKDRSNSDRFAQACAYAARAHAGQLRKGTTIPYISHPLSVAALILEFGGDEDQAIAGLLHDVLEDCGREHEPAIRDAFGNRVAEIVLACSDGFPDADGKKPPWKIRKSEYLKRLSSEPTDVLLVSACDKLHNARSIADDLASGHDVFARFTASQQETIWYYRTLVDLFEARLRQPHRLVRQLADTVLRFSLT